jgi:CheY-like chemotaxis protein
MDAMTAGTYVVLLSAFAFDASYEGQKAIEPDMCIPKPVRQQLLRNALLAARSPRTREPATAAPKRLGVAAASGSTQALGLNVLVVDDNAVNREVAVAMLEDCHCRVDVAAEGRVAVKQAHAQRFDVILMDCQMPGMDGYAATMAIRRYESERGAPPTPIVALTANVMSRDRARCIAAGMNSFLAKPFTSAQLIAVLMPIAAERGTLAPLPPPPEAPSIDAPLDVVSASSDAGPEPEPSVPDMLDAPIFTPAPLPASTVLDFEQIQAIQSLGKPAAFEKLCSLLFESAPTAIKAIEAALAASDLATVAATAHSLKSACGNLGGRELAAQLDRCESAARDQRDINAARDAARGLRHAYAALQAALKEESSPRTGT